MVIREIIKSYQADVAEIVQGINELFKGKKLHEKIEMMGSYEPLVVKSKYYCHFDGDVCRVKFNSDANQFRFYWDMKKRKRIAFNPEWLDEYVDTRKDDCPESWMQCDIRDELYSLVVDKKIFDMANTDSGYKLFYMISDTESNWYRQLLNYFQVAMAFIYFLTIGVVWEDNADMKEKFYISLSCVFWVLVVPGILKKGVNPRKVKS